MSCYSLFLLLTYDPFLIPLDWLPSFKLNIDFIRTHVLEEVEIDEPIDSISCQVEGFIDLDEDGGHVIINLNDIKEVIYHHQ